jgi:hypothetical protein
MRLEMAFEEKAAQGRIFEPYCGSIIDNFARARGE